MNKAGVIFLNEARSIIAECSRLESPAQAARVAVFAMLVMLDGSGEHVGEKYRLLTEGGKPVEFFHHDLDQVRQR